MGLGIHWPNKRSPLHPCCPQGAPLPPIVAQDREVRTPLGSNEVEALLSTLLPPGQYPDAQARRWVLKQMAVRASLVRDAEQVAIRQLLPSDCGQLSWAECTNRDGYSWSIPTHTCITIYGFRVDPRGPRIGPVKLDVGQTRRVLVDLQGKFIPAYLVEAESYRSFEYQAEAYLEQALFLGYASLVRVRAIGDGETNYFELLGEVAESQGRNIARI